MRTVSLTMRRAMSGQETGQVVVTLLTIHHPTLATPVRLSSDPTQRISDDPLRYGTVSRGQVYSFFPFAIQLPDDQAERAPTASVVIENVSRELINLIRSTSTRAQISIELVLAKTADIVETAWPIFDLNNVTYNADTISLDLSLDSYSNEPFPAGAYNPANFPGLF